jgi:DNA polymerase I-like protein with 3'-5' exonuclease and polymerase domains
VDAVSTNTCNRRRRRRKTRKQKVRSQQRRIMRLAAETIERLSPAPDERFFFTAKYRGTQTGRTSSSAPNIQEIKRALARGRETGVIVLPEGIMGDIMMVANPRRPR